MPNERKKCVCDYARCFVDERTLTVKEGDIVTVDCLEWIDPFWEFDNPCVVIRPIYREFETSHTEHAIEDVLLDLVGDGTVPVRIGGPHRWNILTLKRRFAEALDGKEFPERNYEATRVTVRITRDADGLMWEEVSNA